MRGSLTAHSDEVDADVIAVLACHASQLALVVVRASVAAAHGTQEARTLLRTHAPRAAHRARHALRVRTARDVIARVAPVLAVSLEQQLQLVASGDAATTRLESQEAAVHVGFPVRATHRVELERARLETVALGLASRVQLTHLRHGAVEIEAGIWK